MEEKSQTRKKLIKAGIKLFSKYGYAATTTRMIASEAGVNLSAIAFHYSTKECLYVACLEYMLGKIKGYYEKSYQEIERVFQNHEVTPEKAYHLLEKLIDLQIEVAFVPRYQSTLSLIYWEDNGPEGMRPLSTAVFDRQEHVMARLLRVVAPITEERAMIASRHINGSIIAFGEHRNLTKSYMPDVKGGEEVPFWLRDEIKGNCLAIVRHLIEPVDLPPHLLA